MDGAKPASTPRRLKDMWGDIKTSVVIQILLLVLTSIIMDGGRSFTFMLIPIVAHWIVFLLIAFRRRNHLTRGDTILIKAGFLIFLVALPLFVNLLSILFSRY